MTYPVMNGVISLTAYGECYFVMYSRSIEGNGVIIVMHLSAVWIHAMSSFVLLFVA